MGRRPPYARTVVALVVLAAATALLASCGSGSSTTTQATSPPSTVAATSTSATTAASTTSTAGSTSSAGSTSTAPATGTTISAEDAQAVRDLVAAYWKAYNAYDPDTAVSYLNETYRTTKEQSVRDEIGRIKTFGVTLGVSEKTAPVLIGPDQAEMYVNMKEPTGTRTMWMKFVKHGDTWTITYSEEAK